MRMSGKSKKQGMHIKRKRLKKIFDFVGFIGIGKPWVLRPVEGRMGLTNFENEVVDLG